jgi:uncharacterized protein (DUF302 family)
MKVIESTVDQSMDEVEPVIRQALSDQGFGILTEIDVAATLQAKLGVARPPLRILGACNPSFARRSLDLDPSVALLLPCNVVLEESGEGQTHVAIADPRALMDSLDSPARAELDDLAAEAAAALETALARLSG